MSENNTEKPKWYFNTWSLIISFFCIGPFMLPLVWTNPHFSINKKIVISVIVITLTYVMTSFLLNSLKSLLSSSNLLSEF